MKKHKKIVLVFIFPLEARDQLRLPRCICRMVVSVRRRPAPRQNGSVLAAVLRFPSPKTIRVEHFSDTSSILFTPKLTKKETRFSLHFPFGGSDSGYLGGFPGWSVSSSSARSLVGVWRALFAAVLWFSLPNAISVEHFSHKFSTLSNANEITIKSF